MTEREIIDKTRAILNEIGEEANLALLSEDTVKIEEYITSVIPEAVNLVQINSPVRCVNRKSGVTSAEISSNADGRCSVALPVDYVSLIAVKLQSWKRSCVKAFDMYSEEYKCQCNSYTRAGAYRPICVLGYSTNGSRELWMYSISPSSKTTFEMFVYEAKYSDGLDLDVNDPLASAVCYMAASLVYSIFENKDSSQEMRAIALNLIPK